MENFLNLLKILSEGLGTTLLIFLLTLVLGIPAGILVAVARNSKNRIVKTLIKIYILILLIRHLLLFDWFWFLLQAY